jgi:CheY-like chemotaxis protein
METPLSSKLETQTVIPETHEHLSRRVLVADDEYLNRTSMEGFLRDEGYQVVCVTNGQELVDELNRDQNFDLVLTDKNMPGLDGIKAINQFRQDKRFKTIPVILMTTEILTASQIREIKSLNVGYLEKPFSWKNLETTIEQVTKTY